MFSYGFKLKEDEGFFLKTLNLICLYQFVPESYNKTIIHVFSINTVDSGFTDSQFVRKNLADKLNTCISLTGLEFCGLADASI